MGWWQVQGTENVIGDMPLDILQDAAAAVVLEYEKAWGRRPTRAEGEVLLRSALRGDDPEHSLVDEGVARVRLSAGREPA